MIDFLLSPDKIAKKLRARYIFKIIPMLNPDGIRYGNYRCCTLGYDQNRKWKKPHPKLQSPIYLAKEVIANTV